MDYSKLDDLTLINLVLRQDENALSALYDRYSNLVFSIALNILEDRRLAEEVVQDVFLRLWQKSGSYDARVSKLNTWISRITRNRSIDLLRKGQVRQKSITSYWAQLEDSRKGSEENVESSIEVQMQKAKVRQAIHQLPPEQQEAIALAYFKGLSQSQIAQELNEPLGTIKTRIRSGMQKLKQYLAENGF